jgi:hypothetical protein
LILHLLKLSKDYCFVLQIVAAEAKFNKTSERIWLGRSGREMQIPDMIDCLGL